MDLGLGGKRALVTGASYGLGFACARMLAAEGTSVTISARNVDTLEKAAQAIENDFQTKVARIAADLTLEDDLDHLAQSGPYDILLLSTGHPPTYPFSTATDEQWQTGYDLIINPVVKLSRRFLPAMKEKGYGRLIFIGSIFGLEPESSSVIQSTFRTGLNALSKCIATEYAPYGITANVLCPGYFSTPLVTTLAGQYAAQEGRPVEAVLDDWQQYAPGHMFGNPDDLGAFVCFLASMRGAFINGTSLTMDGGAIRSY